MVKKTTAENKIDDNGIIIKQSEVYVWNDKVFASYKSALAASKWDVLIEALAQKYCQIHYPNYTPSQVAGVVKAWKASPRNYTVYVNEAVDVFTEFLAS